MSTLSQFAPFAGGGLKSFQTGYLYTSSLSNGSGEDNKFFDVTVSSVSTSKTICSFAGSGNSGSNSQNQQAAYSDQNLSSLAIFSSRMTSSTNLRLAASFANGAPQAIAGRWQIAEAN